MSSPGSRGHTPSGTDARRLFLDCDTGIDDALALAYLLTFPGVELVGAGAVSGNVDAQRAGRNIAALLALAGRRDVPVAVGSRDHLGRTYQGGAPHIHGRNGIGDIQLPAVDTAIVPLSAAELLVETARRDPGSLSVIATGPLTNLARALEIEPRLPELVRDVTVMGGAVHVRGNVTPVAEANIYNDPEAADLVLQAGWPLTLVPLDATMPNTFEEHHLQAIKAAENPLVQAVAGMLDFYFDFYRTILGRRAAVLHDPLAAAIAIGTVIPVDARTATVSVDTSTRPGRGQTTDEPQPPPITETPTRPAHRIILDAGRSLAADIVERLRAQG